jgi:hypothetical protein
VLEALALLAAVPLAVVLDAPVLEVLLVGVVAWALVDAAQPVWDDCILMKPTVSTPGTVFSKMFSATDCCPLRFRALATLKACTPVLVLLLAVISVPLAPPRTAHSAPPLSLTTSTTR